MQNAAKFRQKLKSGSIVLGTVVGSPDPCVTEALSYGMDFVWIDMEHSPLTVERVQGHLMATKGGDCAGIVRVPWNDAVLIKPVLDVGADGVIVPMIRSVEEAERAIAACRYPPEGNRGFGPRRPSAFGRLSGPEFCRSENQSVLTILQIEHIDAINNIDAIAAVPGIASLVLGPNDLSGSMGHMGEPQHPEVKEAIEKVIVAGHKTGVPVGIGTGINLAQLTGWIEKGIDWIAMGSEYVLMIEALNQVSAGVRSFSAKGAKPSKEHAR